MLRERHTIPTCDHEPKTAPHTKCLEALGRVVLTQPTHEERLCVGFQLTPMKSNGN